MATCERCGCMKETAWARCLTCEPRSPTEKRELAEAMDRLDAQLEKDLIKIRGKR